MPGRHIVMGWWHVRRAAHGGALGLLALGASSFGARASGHVRRASAAPLCSRRDSLWLGGRVDSTRVAIYFDSISLRGSLPKNVEISRTRTAGMLPFAIVDSRYLDSLRPRPKRWFNVGDRFELLGGRGQTASARVTDFIVFPGDEGTGNSSYVGALATITSARPFTAFHVVARRSGGRARDSSAAGIVDQPLDSSLAREVRDRIRAFLTDQPTEAIHPRLPPGTPAKESAAGRDRVAQLIRRDAQTSPLTLDDITAFRLANGEMRYYARARLVANDAACTVVGAWLRPASPLRVTAGDARGCAADLPKQIDALLNVVDVGEGHLVLIVETDLADGFELSLVEFRDGASVPQMCSIQSIGQSE